MLQDRLNALTLEPEEFKSALPAPVKARVDALEKLQVGRVQLLFQKAWTPSVEPAEAIAARAVMCSYCIMSAACGSCCQVPRSA